MSTELSERTGYFCGWCGHWTKVGRHLPGGKFDPCSVPVSEAEIDKAIYSYRGKLRNDSQNYPRDRARTRVNIALGKHAGSYEEMAPAMHDKR